MWRGLDEMPSVTCSCYAAEMVVTPQAVGMLASFNPAVMTLRLVFPAACSSFIVGAAFAKQSPQTAAELPLGVLPGSGRTVQRWFGRLPRIRRAIGLVRGMPFTGPILNGAGGVIMASVVIVAVSRNGGYRVEAQAHRIAVTITDQPTGLKT
jgi:hypothetical protein